ncbi:MAG: glycosyltransferase family 4 protein [Proteobacteria bacterium]|nr:glycosyltransferase family 4 protein [Pseudomonadota bacterium]
MKILQLTGDWKWTGPAEPMLHLAGALRESGHAVDLALPDPPPGASSNLLDRARERGFEPVHRLARRQGYWPVRDGAEVRGLRRLLRERGYDVVHAHHTRDQILAKLALRGQRAARVLSWHHGDPIPTAPWHRWLYGPAGNSGLAVLSERLAERARSGLGWAPERVAVAPGSVDVERFRPRPASAAVRHELGLGEGACVIGLVARLQTHRRVELLLEAFSRARERAPELRLLVVGRGTRARQVLDEPVARMGLGDGVIRAGYRVADYVEVLSVLHALVFLVPGSDGSCRAVLEAMAMGLPVIATGRGTLPETVVDGETGRVLPESPEAFASAFVELCRDPAVWGARGAAGRRRALSRHTPEQQARSLERLYAELCGGG